MPASFAFLAILSPTLLAASILEPFFNFKSLSNEEADTNVFYYHHR